MKRSFACASVATFLPAFAVFALPVSSDPVQFRLRTGDGAFSAPYSEVSNFAITYGDGETVSATSFDGATVVDVQTDPAAAAGSAAFAPTKGGVWTLENSNGAKAYIGVDWSVFNDGWTLSPSAPATGRIDTVLPGPDRTAKTKGAPPVAYSGDDWVGDLSKAATLTFTSPSGVVSTPALDPSGEGALEFRFDEIGTWTVALGFADGTSRSAEINVTATGLTIIFR